MRPNHSPARPTALEHGSVVFQTPSLRNRWISGWAELGRPPPAMAVGRRKRRDAYCPVVFFVVVVIFSSNKNSCFGSDQFLARSFSTGRSGRRKFRRLVAPIISFSFFFFGLASFCGAPRNSNGGVGGQWEPDGGIEAGAVFRAMMNNNNNNNNNSSSSNNTKRKGRDRHRLIGRLCERRAATGRSFYLL